MVLKHVQHELDADRRDFYQRRVRWLALPALAVYTALVLFNQHTIEFRNDLYQSESRDGGLRMALRRPFPPFLLALHSWAAVLLYTTTLLQKYLVGRMRAEYAVFIGPHRWLGRLVLMLTAMMDIGGYLMGPYSAFERFSTFSVLFAAPWLVWIISIYATATQRYIRWHRLLSNMLVKGCIATPFARLAGATLQRAGWGDAAGYYQGIGFVSAVIAIWQLVELYEFAFGGSLQSAPPSQTVSHLEKKRS